jgi:ligand-binding sensor domain-containing protein/serine phosphatase RsbU (regulator of sigma subunit)
MVEEYFMRASFIIALFLLFINGIGWAQKPDLQFKHLSTEQNLSNSHILDIVQDHKGYLWFGTEDGLNRYDGYQINNYWHNPDDSSSIGSNQIYALFEDSNQDLWIATSRKLHRYRRETDRFEHFNYIINRICEDEKAVWMATSSSVLRYDKKNKTFTPFITLDQQVEIGYLFRDSRNNIWVHTSNGLFIIDQAKRALIPQMQMQAVVQNVVVRFVEDEQHQLWMATLGNGLFRYDSTFKNVVQYKHDPANPNSLSGNNIESIAIDTEGRVWLGLQNAGLSILDPKTNTFYNYQREEGDPESLSYNTVSPIYRDKAGQMWLGTFAGGVNMVSERNFACFRRNVASANSLSNNNVTSFCEDGLGNIWIGTDGGGLDVYNRTTGRFTHYKHDPNNPKSISTNVITSLFADQKGTVWIGYWMGGMDRYDQQKNEFVHHLHAPKGVANQYTTNCVMYLYVDKQSNVWACTLKGAYMLDRKSNQFVNYTIEGGKLKNNIAGMLEDKDGNLWAGSWDGLQLIDRQTRQIRHFMHDEKDRRSLSSNKIFVLHEDRKGRIWIGTAAGLNQFDKKGRFEVFAKKDGFPSDAIYGILEDENENLWLSTGNGLCRFNPDSKSVKTYDVNAGLQGNEFKKHAYCQLKSGEMLFGGENGFNLFHPRKLRSNQHVPPVLITDFKIFNKSVPVDSIRSVLRWQVSETPAITLSHRDQVFSFDFTALNYLSPEKNQYAYKMEGFDKDWNQVGTQRTATYTNLDPGKYVFRVIASNNDGLWNEKGTSIRVVITPPFWETWWFRLLASLTVTGCAFTFYWVRINAVKAQKVELERLVSEQTAEVMQQKEELQAQADFLQVVNEEFKESQEEVEVQRDNLQQINEKVMSSIHYAYTIQQATLPSARKISSSLPEHFVLYRPKDVVSGDFYWYAHLTLDSLDVSRQVLERIDSDLTFIAAIDCTGHGVPGAFMSIIGNTLLNEIVNQKHIFDPALILEELNKGVRNALEKSEEVNTAGMDVCLLRIQCEEGGERKVQFAGAKRPVFFVRKGSSQVELLEGDRRSIGTKSKAEKPFTTHELIIEEETNFYLSSDGFVDQNNPQREKLGTPKLKELITQAVMLTMDEQKHLFERALNQHQQDAQQRDDIMLIGIKF